jgi:hypothetical protein
MRRYKPQQEVNIWFLYLLHCAVCCRYVHLMNAFEDVWLTSCQRMFIYNPDSFVNPRNCITYASTITHILKDPPTSSAAGRNEWDSIIESGLNDVARRNDALLFRIIPERATATAKFTMNDVKVQFILPRLSSHASFSHL